MTESLDSLDKICGPDNTVEIDESKFGKRKCALFVWHLDVERRLRAS